MVQAKEAHDFVMQRFLLRRLGGCHQRGGYLARCDGRLGSRFVLGLAEAGGET
jgi:hypothetical protein